MQKGACRSKQERVPQPMSCWVMVRKTVEKKVTHYYWLAILLFDDDKCCYFLLFENKREKDQHIRLRKGRLISSYIRRTAKSAQICGVSSFYSPFSFWVFCAQQISSYTFRFTYFMHTEGELF